MTVSTKLVLLINYEATFTSELCDYWSDNTKGIWPEKTTPAIKRGSPLKME